MNLHAHFETTSRDCDSTYDRTGVIRPNDDEVAESKKDENDFSDIHFMERVFSMQCSPYAVRAMTITVTEDGFEWNESTEEGYNAGEVRWCSDERCDDKRTFRDHTAESMGY